ncbi:DUF58 domain-containing protein [Thiohalorhabdus sp. Cl-TMA]|uniref:DUF58 domain-containing protein n=1 Tax=Thiohalorhabdus methylotrophus TaxID=3242694 RepID=A0ABV4TSA0_9GAMM
MRAPRFLQGVVDRLVARRMGLQGGRVALTYRRIFILPTRAGLGFAALLGAIWLGAVNYGNSMAYLLVFLLAGVANAAMLHNFRNLLGVTVQGRGADPVFAGGVARFHVRLAESSGRSRMGLSLLREAHRSPSADVPADGSGDLVVEVPAEERGPLPVGRFVVGSRFPAGLFQAWSWVRPDWSCVVYPRPESGTVPEPPAATGGESGGEGGEDTGDFRGLRRYQSGDPPRHVAWRLVARGQDPQTKVFAGAAATPAWLDWAALEGLEPEARLSRLCRWVLDAEHQARPYGLRLPGREIPPGRGAEHRHRCLAALACWGS